MNSIHYLCHEAIDFFPHIDFAFDAYVFSAVYKAAMLVLFKDRVTEEEDIGLVTGEPHADSATDTIYLAAKYDRPSVESYVMPDGYQEVQAAKLLVQRGYYARAWVNEEKRIGFLLFAGKVPNYAGAALFPQLAPWKFRDNPPTEMEKKFILALINNQSGPVEELLRDYIKFTRIAEKLTSSKLDKFMNTLLEAKLRSARAQEEDTLRRIYELEQQIAALRETYRRHCDLIMGIQYNHHNDEIDEFRQIFLSNPSCHLESVNNTTLTFFLTRPLTNFNEDAYDSMTSNEHSCVFDYAASLGLTSRQMRKMYNALFIENRYRVHVFGGFTVDFENNRIHLLRGEDSNSVGENCIPNPHIYYYACQGGYAADYSDAFSRYDYADVLTTALSEVANINWTDISPVRKFAADLCSNYRETPCIWDKQEKEYITPWRLAERIKNNEQ